MAHPEPTLSDVLDALDDDDPRQALADARFLFGWPSAPGDRADAAECALVLARIAEAFEDPSVQDAARRVAAHPDDADALYELGYALLEQRLGLLSAGVLSRANRLRPHDPEVLSELASALEEALRFSAMVEVLGASPGARQASFMCRYLYAFGAVMSGDLATAAGAAEALAPAAHDHNEQLMSERIRRMLARAAVASAHSPLDDQDLRGWHYVTQGGLLTSRSPFGREEGMNGRWAWTQDSHDRIRFGLDRLVAALDALGERPRRVIALPDRGSQIVGHAAATLLGVPLAPWTPPLPSTGLLLAYDLATVPREALPALREARLGLPLFSHALCWTEAGPIAPDLATLLYQTNTAPWEPHLGVDAETLEVTQRDADQRPVEAIAHDILQAIPAASLDEAEDRAALITLCKAVATAGDFPTPGLRDMAWAGSPVASARFV